MIVKSLRTFTTVLLLTACGTNPDKPYSDTPTSGKVNITADESLVPLADAQLDTFHGLYRYAAINMRYKPESALFADLVNDSAKVIMSTRTLNEQEQNFFKAKNLIPVTTKIAIDALAIIINKENSDSLLKISQLKKILLGETSSWNQLNVKSKLGNIAFVFDQNGSSTVRYLKDSLMEGKIFPEYCFAAKSNADVIDYVEKNKNAIGVIGVSWISDGDDPSVKGFLNRIVVVELGNDNAVSPNDYYKPYQAYIAMNQYPLVREVYMISREGRAGLGTGFVSFVAGDQGQRIIRLMGLLPVTMPVRIVKM